MVESESLMLEHLRAIRATQAEHTERLNRIELQLAAQGQQLGALTTAVYRPSTVFLARDRLSWLVSLLRR
jgi:hypothetical protein